MKRIPEDVNRLPSDEEAGEPQQCRNCGILREVYDYIIEECPNCGDYEYSILEQDYLATEDTEEG